jgi:hypothetical protein
MSDPDQYPNSKETDQPRMPQYRNRTLLAILIPVCLVLVSACPQPLDTDTPPPCFSLRYDGNGAIPDTVPGDTCLEPGSMVTVADATTLIHEDHLFIGWNTVANGSGTGYAAGGTFSMPAADVVLYAIWQEIMGDARFSVNFNANGGSGTVSPLFLIEGQIGSLPANNFMRTGYSFEHWNSLANGDGTVFFAGAELTMGTNDLILYAQWRINSYEVIYEGNLASTGSPPGTMAHEYGSTVQIANAADLQRNGFIFQGWNTRPDGYGTQYSPGAAFRMPAHDVILYALWSVYSDPPVDGEMLVRTGSFLFRIGGRDENGAMRSRVLRASIQPDGSIGPWSTMASLPLALADAAAIAAGNMIYVIGGTAATGPSDRILYAQISNTGSFVYANGWVTNPRPLPQPLTQSAASLHDGRIFLAGGGSTASPEMDTIMHARVYHDGQLGYWYRSPQKLPSPVSRAAAVIAGDRLIVVGGSHDGRPVNLGVRFELMSNGLLGEPELLPLPAPRESVVLTNAGSDLLLFGGRSSQPGQPPVLALRQAVTGTTWTSITDPVDAPAIGPTNAKAHGRLLTTDGRGRLLSIQPAVDTLNPDTPSFYPGSGIVPSSFNFRWEAEPEVRLMVDGTVVMNNYLTVSPPRKPAISWTIDDPYQATQPVLNLDFRKSPYPLLNSTIDSLALRWRDLSLGTELQIAAGSTYQFFQFETPSRLSLRLECYITIPTANQPTVLLDLYEADMYTAVIDDQGQALTAIPVGTSSISVTGTSTATLSRGQYYGGIRIQKALQAAIKVHLHIATDG